MTILYINANIRKTSRTDLLARYLLAKYNEPIEEIIVNNENIHPLNTTALEKRDKLIENKEFDNPIFKYAKQFANADIIVIAAPLWDLSFPAILKTYFENINVTGITFYYGETGAPQTLCKAKELIYITTAGGHIASDEYGFGYIKTLCSVFYGIQDVKYIKAEKLDIIGSDINNILSNAKKEIDNLHIN